MAGFSSIGLREMEAVELMSRFDSKYIFNRSLLTGFLLQLQPYYKVLTIDGLPLFRYENLYFDTPALQSYTDHHNGKAGRFKVRLRRYTDTSKSYLEVKKKTNKGQTLKSRQRAEGISRELTAAQLDFAKSQLGRPDITLLPQLANNFSRITLVNEKDRERVTIDLLIHFSNNTTEKSLDDLVIAEVKQHRSTSLSAFKKLMQSNRIFPTGFSKYCLGTLLTCSGIKYNRFKPKLTALNKICNAAD
ncbi:MAG: polyphosphate polymerase domain-containing protein [Chitinophagales bacterium]|nr:polyphosphate polymerase domain-containing protein [Chitinophagales bacterium]